MAVKKHKKDGPWKITQVRELYGIGDISRGKGGLARHVTARAHYRIHEVRTLKSGNRESRIRIIQGGSLFSFESEASPMMHAAIELIEAINRVCHEHDKKNGRFPVVGRKAPY